MPDDCTICGRTDRRSHGGVMVCPRCDLNEVPATPAPAPTPKVMPRRRPPVNDTKET